MQLRSAKRRQEYPLVRTKDPAAIRMTTQAQREWLERSIRWKDLSRRARVGHWRPRKILGAGVAAIVGLWELIDDEDLFGNDRRDPTLPTLVAVKQGGNDEVVKRNMQWESHLLQQLMNSNSDHVVKIYKGFHLDMGTGTHEYKDPTPYSANGKYDSSLAVCRIYLEYCARGDLHRLLTRFGAHYFVPEEQLWRIILCIFKGLLVLERGTEDTGNPAAGILPAPALWPNSIVHFDIKLENILIGERDQGEHQRLESFKLADFGAALPMPPAGANLNGTNWVGNTAWRGTADHMPPEQFYLNNHPQDFLISQKTSVWSAASSIFQFCTGTTIDKGEFCNHPISGILSICSPEILFDSNEFPYSHRLALVLCTCLSWRPNQRPNIIDVVRQAQTMVNLFEGQNIAGAVPILGDELTSQAQPNIPITAMYTGLIPASQEHGMVQRGRTPYGPAGAMPAPVIPFHGARQFDFPIIKWSLKPLVENYPFKDSVLYNVPAALVRAAQAAARRAAQAAADALALFNVQAALAAANPPQVVIVVPPVRAASDSSSS